MKSEATRSVDYYLNLRYGVAMRKDEDGDWVARVEELPGCVAHGETTGQALDRLEELKKAWIEDAIESGDSIPEPQSEEALPSGKWLQRVPRSLHKNLTELAEREGVSLNQLVTTILAEAVGRSRTGSAAVSILDSADVGVWGNPFCNWSKAYKGSEISGWQIDQQKPIEFVIDALASQVFGLPNQINEFQFRVTEKRASKKELTYKS